MSAICKVEGCERVVNSRGWCHSHYTQWRRGREMGRFRSDLTPEWFDLIDAVEAARILRDTPTGPLAFTKLYRLQAQGKIQLADDSAATGPRFYRGDVERWMGVSVPLEPEVDPMKPAKGVLLACALGAALLGIVGLNVWYWVVR